MKKMLLLAGTALTVLLASACGGSGMPDPSNTMGPGNMGDDMRVAAVDTVSR
jgi:hypothetical protein